MIHDIYGFIVKSLFWRRVNTSENVIDKKIVERYFDKTQDIIFTDAYARIEEAVLLPYLIELKIASVLDLGCGNGRYARVLSNYLQEYVGVDLSSNFIKELSNQFETDKFTFVHSAAHEFKSERKFDLILMIGLITYMNDADIFEMLLNSSNHLNRDGFIVVRNVHHSGKHRAFFDDRLNIFKRFQKKPTYQIVRRPETEFLNMFRQFQLIRKLEVSGTAGIIYIFKKNENR